MSSFRKRTTTVPIPGTRPSSSHSLPLVSTGLATLDDLLGGGLPLTNSLLLTQDYPTQYSQLLLKYYIAQGLESNQTTIVIGSGGEINGNPEMLVKGLMGVDVGDSTTAKRAKDREDEEDEEEMKKKEEEMKEKMKIAFRYEGMKQHRTTLESSTPNTPSTSNDVFCSTFDLTTTRTLTASDHEKLHSIDVDDIDTSSSPSTNGVYEALYERIEKFVTENGFLHSTESTTSSTPKKALRIAISSLGSPAWGSSSPTSLYTFLHRLKSLHRRSHSTSMTTFPSHLYSLPSSSSSSPLLTRLTHSADSVLSLTSFALSPPLQSLYPRHSGLINLVKLPTPQSLVPPSTKLSLLMNLSGSSSTSKGGGGEDSSSSMLGFRVKRRRFIVEVISDEPGFENGDEGDKEEKRKKELRRKRVEEANRKERESGGNATDVLLREKGKGKEKVKEGGGVEIELEKEEEEERQETNAVNLNESTTTTTTVTQDSISPHPYATQTTPSSSLTSSLKKKPIRKGVRMGGVSFQGDNDNDEPANSQLQVEKKDVGSNAAEQEKPEKKKKVSISAMLHRQPELLDF